MRFLRNAFLIYLLWSIRIPAFGQSAWTERYPWTSRAGSLNSVIWTGKQAVAVGTTILTSPDGDTWTSRISETSNTLYSVTWTGSGLVAVGDTGTIINSPDGKTWTMVSSGTQTQLRSITWTGSLLVAVGDSGTILTSPDGITWSARNSGTTSLLKSVVWNGSQLLVLGKEIITSSDGVMWSKHSGMSDAMQYGPVLSAIWTGTQFVAVNDVGIFTSPDGLTWTDRGGLGDCSMYSVVSTGSQLIAGGISWAFAGGCLMTSTDGVSWSPSKDWHPPGNSALPPVCSMAWTGREIVAADIGGRILTASQDPIAIIPHQNSNLDFSIRISGNTLSFSVPEGLRNNSMKVTVYSLSSGKVMLSQPAIQCESGGSVAFDKLNSGQYIFELKAGDRIYTEQFQVAW